MKYMTTAEIREEYLRYFESKGCKRWPSSSLIPDDPSLLLTSAGMVQFKPYYLQQKKLPEPYIGTTTAQKCVRTNDIEIIGKTGRHLTFFEMLGNFSFGAYFKEEMCEWALDFSVNVLGLPFERLYFTVYKDDDESIEIWKNLGVDPSHITKLGEEDNFWRAGPTGPCGPCSELYYDQGEEFGCGSPDCAPGCDCDRYLEYWNLVFTQFDGQEDGSFVPLPKKNIDTGMGLERMAAIMQGVSSNYETDIMRGLIHIGEDTFNKKYGENKEDDLNLRIIADHSRAISFMIADGILPGNEGREYVLRRLLRRCVVKAFLMDYKGPFLANFINEIIDIMGPFYPELVDNKKLILRVVLSEEQRFGQTLEQGSAMLNKILEDEDGNTPDYSDLPEDERPMIPGEDVFVLHDTYGFPMEVTKEIAEDRGFVVDIEGFEACMKEQVERARSANADETEAAWDIEDSIATRILEEHGVTNFVGYDNLEYESKVIALVKDGKETDILRQGETGSACFIDTPFYGEMGGQVGDTGMIYVDDNNYAEVLDTVIPESGLLAHKLKVIKGTIKNNDKAMLKVDVKRRARITRNHTATHVLHWALREVLGDHVKQAGSYVAPERLRFDFTHFEAIPKDKLVQIEQMANNKIMEAHPVSTYQTSLKEARKSGVVALFGEKYGEEVRVVNVDEFSKELCGGCHVKNTAEIGLVKIVSESSVGANARRIEACTSYDAYSFFNDRNSVLEDTAAVMRCPVGQVLQIAQKQIKDIKKLNKELEFAYSKATSIRQEDIMSKVVKTKDGYDLCVLDYRGVGDFDIKEAWDVCTDHLGDNAAAVIGQEKNGKALLLAAGTAKAVEAGFNAVDVIKNISKHIQGGGGGKPRMAQAGGKNVDGIPAALEAAKEMLV